MPTVATTRVPEPLLSSSLLNVSFPSPPPPPPPSPAAVVEARASSSAGFALEPSGVTVEPAVPVATDAGDSNASVTEEDGAPAVTPEEDELANTTAAAPLLLEANEDGPADQKDMEPPYSRLVAIAIASPGVALILALLATRARRRSIPDAAPLRGAALL